MTPIEREYLNKCPCGCEDNLEEIYPFICNHCKGFYDCDVVINGFCICPECEKDKYILAKI